MSSSYGIPPVIAYDLVTRSEGFGYAGPTDDLRTAATNRVSAAVAGVYEKRPSTARVAKKPARDNSEAYYLAAYWLGTGALETGYDKLARAAKSYLDEGDSYYDGWASWATAGVMQSGGEGTDKIQTILNDALKLAGTWGAQLAADELKKLVMDNVDSPPDDTSVPERVGRSFKEWLISSFVPAGLRDRAWIIPVGLVSIIVLAIAAPIIIKRVKKG
jgi:hypothetical protein